MTSASAVWSKQRPVQSLLWQYSQAKSAGASTRVIESLKVQLVAANQGLVRVQAARAAKQCRVDFEDLVQEGNIGLLKAIEEFEPAQGNAFSSFAVPKIRGAIQHFLRDRGWGDVRPPRRVVEQYAAVKKVQREAQKFGRTLTEEQAAEGCGIDAERWAWMVQARSNRPPISLEDSELQIAAEEQDQTEEQTRTWVVQRWAALPAVQRGIVSEYFFAGRSLAQIAKQRRIRVSVAELLLNQAIAQLKHQAEEEAL